MMNGSPTSAPPPAAASAPDRRLPLGTTRLAAFIVLDDDPAMEFWDAEIDTLQASVRELDVFTSVQTRQLITGPKNTFSLADGTSPESLSDGPHAVFLVTPGRSLTAFHGLITAWARAAPVAVVDLLQQQHWRDRGLRVIDAAWTPSDRPQPAASMPWRVSGLDLRSAEEKRRDSTRTVVPILERGADWIARWARLLDPSGGDTVAIPAVLLSPDDVPPANQLSAAMLVSRFRATASPQAFALATRMSAAPLNVRTMRALQRSVLRSGPSHLTEVLTSTLVHPPKHRRSRGDTSIVYEFVFGVREQLLALAYRDRTIEVQRIVEDELTRDVDAVRNLTHRVTDPRRATYQAVNYVARPFLEVEFAVHVALGGPNLNAAKRLGPKIGRPVPPSARRVPSPGVLPNPRMESLMSETIPAQGSSGPVSAEQPTVGLRYDREGSTLSTYTDSLRSPQRQDSRFPAIIGNLPMRNTNFIGRRDLLDTLHERLRAGTTAVLPEAVHGSGGVGKSQLVIEYVHLHQQDFDLIWWIPAEFPAQIQNSLTELASRLNLDVPSTANTAVPAVLDTLRIGRPYSNWLLVFDNAEDPDQVREFFPKGGPGSIVITSRNAGWSGIASTLPVDVFDRQESIDLMRRHEKILSVDAAGRLAQRLGDLPLAIEAATAWRAAKNISVDDYIAQLDASQPEFEDASAEGELDYPAHIAAVWNISLTGLRESDPSVLRLLQLCAFFAPEPIKNFLLSKPRGMQVHPDLEPLLRNTARRNQAIVTIGRLALARIDYRTNSPQMHRLVQRVLINQMSPETREIMRHDAHLLLAAADPGYPDDAEYWARYADLYPHIVASGAERCLDERVRETILNESKYLWRWGNHAEARDLAQRAYEAWVELGDEAHPDSLQMAAWLGFMHFVNGSYADAAALNAKTLEYYQATLGEEEEATLDAIGAVASDHRVAGDFAGALERSLTVYERASRNLGENWPFTLRSAHNLAVSMRLSGLFGRALQLDEQTYVRRVQVYGTDYSESLSTFGGINLDRRELGDYVAAHANQEQVVATARRVLRYDDHPEVLRQSHGLASFRRKAGQHQEALELSSDVLRRYRSRYGDKHPESVLALLTVSVDQRVTGGLTAAREAGETALEGLRALYGDSHPHTAGAQSDLAVTLRLLGESEAARVLNEKALLALKDRLSNAHPLVLAARINLASDLFELEDFEGAHKLDVESFDQSREMPGLGPEHPTTLACGVNLAMDLRALGRNIEANALFAETVERFRSKLGTEHPATAAAEAGVRANCDIDPLPL